MSTNYSYIYDELLKLNIDLSYDDIPDIKTLQKKTMLCHSYIEKVDRYSIIVERALSIAESSYATEKLNLDLLRQNMLINDLIIKKLPTGKEREAAVNEKLENEHKETLRLYNTVNDLKSLHRSIKQKLSVLLRTNNTDIKNLMKQVDQQINRLNIGHPDDYDMKDLTETYKEIDDLEKEMEKSSNPPEGDELSISQPNSQELVKPADYVETDLQVVVEDADHAGEPLEDVSDYAPIEKTDNHESDSQMTGVGESHFPEEIVSVGDDFPELATSISSKRADARQDTEDFEDGLASFLTEDVTNEIEPEEDVDRDDTGEISTEESTEGAGFAAGEESERVPDIDNKESELDIPDSDDVTEKFDDDDYQANKITDLDLDITGIDLGETGISNIETDIPVSNLSMDDIGETGLSEIPEDKSEISESNINSRELDLPKMDVDLGDLGINLGMSESTPEAVKDIQGESGMSESTPEAVKDIQGESGISESISEVIKDIPVTKSTNKKELPDIEEKKKENAQISKEKSNEDSNLDFDLEDILNSFD